MGQGAAISKTDHAERALAIFAMCPHQLGGIWIRARASPATDRVVLWLKHALDQVRRVAPTIQDQDLFGGFDLGLALSSGTITPSQGILDRPGTLLMPMAERCPRRLAALLGAAIDDGTHAVVALDEGASAEELPPFGLTERLGLFLDVSHLHTLEPTISKADLEAAQNRLKTVQIGPDALTEFVVAASQLGISSARPPLKAVEIAKAHAALLGRDRVEADDLIAAATLAFGHLAEIPDAPEQQQNTETEDAPPEAEDRSDQDMGDVVPSEVIVESAMAALPRDVLSALARGRAARASTSGGSGAAKKGVSRGRPLPSRPGVPSNDARIDTVATLRAALPWQKIRGRTAEDDRLRFRKEDLRQRVYQERTERLLIFTVDASGSQAMTRLAEAKGAVEILLAEAYARRDHVALITFRGTGAEVLLPPTRSLVQAKRRLTALPGGGGTPLAAGLKEALAVADAASAKGMSPTVILLTDGKANIALDGGANRLQAEVDAKRVAQLFFERGIASLIIDTGTRVSKQLTELSSALGGDYLAMPRANALQVSRAVSQTLDD